jgi:hypothetical protein
MSPPLGSFLVQLEPGVTTGAQLAELARREARSSGMTPTDLSRRAFGHAARLGSMERTVGPVRKSTIEHVIAWLKSLPNAAALEGLDVLIEAASRMGRRAVLGEPDPARPVAAAPYPAPTIVAEIDAFLAESGMTEHEFALRAVGWSTLRNLRLAKTTSAAVVDKIRAFIAKKPEPCRRGRVTRAAISAARMRDQAEDKASSIEERRILTDQAHRQRRAGETIADTVRRLAAAAEAEEAAEEAEDLDRRRERSLVEIPDPASLIRRAQRDWPEQSEKVAALAAKFGLSRGEIWRRVIAAGVEMLTEGGI